MARYLWKVSPEAVLLAVPLPGDDLWKQQRQPHPTALPLLSGHCHMERPILFRWRFSLVAPHFNYTKQQRKPSVRTSYWVECTFIFNMPFTPSVCCDSDFWSVAFFTHIKCFIYPGPTVLWYGSEDRAFTQGPQHCNWPVVSTHDLRFHLPECQAVASCRNWLYPAMHEPSVHLGLVGR